MQQPLQSPITTAELTLPSHLDTTRVLEYFGSVNYATNERVLFNLKERMQEDPTGEIVLLVTSPGGPSGSAMSFYDAVRTILKPRLTTIAMGDVDSSGIIIFLSGEKRLVSKRTTLLLHPAGRTFDPSKRYTAPEIAAMAKEDQLKDEQYAALVAEHSRGRLTKGQVLTLMECHTVLSAEKLLELGLCDGLIG